MLNSLWPFHDAPVGNDAPKRRDSGRRHALKPRLVNIAGWSTSQIPSERHSLDKGHSGKVVQVQAQVSLKRIEDGLRASQNRQHALHAFTSLKSTQARTGKSAMSAPSSALTRQRDARRTGPLEWQFLSFTNFQRSEAGTASLISAMVSVNTDMMLAWLTWATFPT